MTNLVNCPSCKKPTLYSKDNPSRPFCSERCKLIDLGEWASEGHRIADSSSEDSPMTDELDQPPTYQ